MVVAGTDSGQPGREHRAATDVERLFADLGDAAHDHVVDQRGVEVVATRRCAFSASEARSTACQFFSFPLRLPPGVRTASTMTAVGIVAPFVGGGHTHGAKPTRCWRGYRHDVDADDKEHGSVARRRRHGRSSARSARSFERYGVDGEDLGWVRGSFSADASWRATPTATVQAGVHAVLLDAAMNFAINAALGAETAPRRRSR